MSDQFDFENLHSWSVWSGDGPKDSKYRYILGYEFLNRDVTEKGFADILFVMMNPSYANEDQWDNTVRRCAGYAWDLGYNGFDVCNLFAFRTPFPKGGTDKHGNKWPPIWKQEDPIGPQNDAFTFIAASEKDMVVCAWGNAGQRMNRGQDVLNLLWSARQTPYALKVNKTGHPAHPLYLPKDLKPKPLTDFENFQDSSLHVPSPDLHETIED